MNGHCRVVPRHQALADLLGQLDRLAAAEVHDQPAPAVDPGPRPGDRAGQAHAGERAARDGEIARRLAVAVDARERVRRRG